MTRMTFRFGVLRVAKKGIGYWDHYYFTIDAKPKTTLFQAFAPSKKSKVYNSNIGMSYSEYKVYAQKLQFAFVFNFIYFLEGEAKH